MKVKDLINKLEEYNQDASLDILIGNYPQYGIEIAFGSSEGCTKDNCENVSLIPIMFNSQETV